MGGGGGGGEGEGECPWRITLSLAVPGFDIHW